MNNIVEYRLLNAFRNPQHSYLLWKVKPEWFTEERQDLFTAMRSAFQTYGTLSHEAIQRFYEDGVPPQMDIDYSGDPMPLIDEVIRLYRKRALAEIENAAKLARSGYIPDFTTIKDLLTTVEQSEEEDSSLNSGIDDFSSRLVQKEGGTYPWLCTGVSFLDTLLGGEWPRQELTLITGASGGGKTALMNSSALNMARMYHTSRESSPVGIFSIEMPKAQLISRFVSDITGINSTHLRLGGVPISGTTMRRPFTPEERQSINEALAELQRLPLYMYDRSAQSADWIIAQAKILHDKFGAQAFFIDYLQLIQFDNDTMHYGLSAAGKAIKNFAKEYNVACIALAQIHDTGKIRDVGDADRDAGCIVRIHLDKDNVDDDGVCPAFFEVSKNRHGPTGKYTGRFDTRHVRFL